MPKQIWKESSQYASTEGDSSSDREQEIFCPPPVPKTNPLKHKTELCKTFSELGFCNYGAKCRFAHGKHQLIGSCQGKMHRNRKCKGFWKNGVCPYGIRCQFGHLQQDWTSLTCLAGMVAIMESQQFPKQSRLLKLL